MSGRGVAQPGSAPALGAGGRWFESSRPDQLSPVVVQRTCNGSQTRAPSRVPFRHLVLHAVSSARQNAGFYCSISGVVPGGSHGKVDTTIVLSCGTGCHHDGVAPGAGHERTCTAFVRKPCLRHVRFSWSQAFRNRVRRQTPEKAPRRPIGTEARRGAERSHPTLSPDGEQPSPGRPGRCRGAASSSVRE